MHGDLISGPSTDPIELLEIGRGAFALILFSLSFYAWTKRRQPALVMVSTAFFLFFVKTFIDYVLPTPTEDFVRIGLDVVALGLIFAAVVVRPRREVSRAIE